MELPHHPRSDIYLILFHWQIFKSQDAKMRTYLSRFNFDRARLISISLFLGSLTLIWFALTAIFTQILFMLNISMSAWHLPISLILTLVGTFLFADFWKLSRKMVLLINLGYILLVVISAIWSGYFLDRSWDGNDYQQRAIIHLQSGWNPIKTILSPETTYYNQEANHYPKLPWIFGSGFYLLMGNIEYGKTPQMLLIFSVFCLSTALLLHFERLNLIQIGLIAFLAALNPISLVQSLSYYVDGWGSSLLIAVFVLFLLLFKRFDGTALFTIFLAVVVALNIKFNFTLYTILFCLGFFFLLSFYWRSRGNKGNVKIGKLFQVLFFSAVVGLVIAGYQPYITNTIEYGNPFYPIIGGTSLNQQSIIGGQLPRNLKGKTALEKFVRSIFSRAGNPIGTNAQFKIPFTTDLDELNMFTNADLRVGGFGPLFSGILLLTCTVFLANLRTANGQKNIAALILIILVSGTIVSNPEFWWARYSPQLWVIPLIVLTLIWLSPARLNPLLGWILSIVMAVNIILIGVSYVRYNSIATQAIRSQLVEMAATNQTYAVDFRFFAPWRLKLEAYRIPYQDFTERKLPCKSVDLDLIVFSTLNCQ
jgi:hypothetical protein